MTEEVRKRVEEIAQKEFSELTYGELAYIRKKYKLVEEINEDEMPKRMSKEETSKYYTQKLQKVWKEI